MAEWQLSDFLATYPSVETEQFQTLISAKKEFNELSSTLNEPTPLKGDPYKHQLLFLRYMREYNDILIADSAGSGKSCEIDGLTEYLYTQHLRSNMDDVNYDVKNAHFKRTIILVKGKSLINEFKYQLACKCTKYRYEKDYILKGRPLTIKLKKLIIKEIEKWYIFYTYETFAKHIKKKYKNNIEAMRIDYNHSIVVVDEAHNLFIDEDIDKSNKDDKTWNKEKTYDYLYYFFHGIQHSKKLLATATPMLNNISEIGKLMNLILPDDLQLPTSTKKNQAEVDKIYQNMTLEEIEPYFRGRITYVRAFETGAKREDQINPNFNIKVDNDIINDQVYMTEMSKFQSNHYKNIEDVKGKVSYSLYLNYASNFVFPDGSISGPEKNSKGISSKKVQNIKKSAADKIPNFRNEESEEDEEDEEDEDDEDEEDEDEDSEEDEEDEESEEIKKSKKTKSNVGYNKYVLEKTLKGKKKQIIYSINTEAKPALKLNNVEDVRKYSSKYGAIIDILKKDKGCSFIYGRYNKGSGNIILGLCLEAVGYERYVETTSMFHTIEGNDDYCRESSMTKILNKKLTKKPRYALLTSETLDYDAAFNSLMELMTSYENRYGEYLECIVASRVVRDGLNFKNMKKIILTVPDWNPSSLFQAISRGIRAGSHDDLLKENPNQTIKVYEMAAVPNQTIVDNLGVDLHIYDIAFNKDKNISQMMLKIAQTNIGCQINYNRNVRENDKDYSSACYYQPCLYQCADPFYTEIDYSTYNAYYIDEDVSKIVKKLILNWASFKNNLYTVDDLSILVEDSLLASNVLLALEYIILNKIQILDAFGYVNYLYESNGIFYINRYYDQSSMDYTTMYLIAYENTKQEMYDMLDLKNYNIFIRQDNDLNKKFEILSINNKIKFLEANYFDYDKKYEVIMSRYKKMFFKLNEIIIKENVLEKKRGRPKDVPCQGTEFKTDNIIYINMLNLLKETNKHNLIPFYFKAHTALRIYINNNWRIATQCETDIYTKELIQYNADRFSEAQEEFKHFFGIDIGGEVLIVYKDPLKITKKVKTKTGIGRDEPRGMECDSFSKDVLLTMAHRLKIKKTDIYKGEKPKTIDQLCHVIKNKLVEEDRML